MADEARAIRDAVRLAGGTGCQEQARRFDRSHRQHGDSRPRAVEAVCAPIDDALDSFLAIHLKREHSRFSVDLEPACPFCPANRCQIDAGLGAEDAALDASPAALARRPSVSALGRERQRVRE